MEEKLSASAKITSISLRESEHHQSYRLLMSDENTLLLHRRINIYTSLNGLANDFICTNWCKYVQLGTVSLQKLFKFHDLKSAVVAFCLFTLLK